MDSKEVSVYFKPFSTSPNEMSEHFRQHGFSDFTHLIVYDNYCFINFNNMQTAQDFINKYDGAVINGCQVSPCISRSKKRQRDPRDPRDYREGPPPPPPPRDIRDRGYRDPSPQMDYGYHDPRGDQRDYRDLRDRQPYREIRPRDPYDDGRDVYPRDRDRDSCRERPRDPRDYRDSRDYGREREYRDRDSYMERRLFGKRTKTIQIRGYPPDQLTERQIYLDFRKLGFIRQVEVKNNSGYIQFDTIEDAEKAANRSNGRVIDGYTIDISFVEDRPLNLPKVSIPVVLMDDKVDKLAKHE